MYALRKPDPPFDVETQLRILCPYCEKTLVKELSYADILQQIKNTTTEVYSRKCVHCSNLIRIHRNIGGEVIVTERQKIDKVGTPAITTHATQGIKLGKNGSYSDKSPKDVNDLSAIMDKLRDYLKTTKKDKYAKSPIDTGADLIGPNGKIINTFQMKKYLARYMTEGFKKSELESDLLKIIHYAMFELLRKQ